MYKLNLVHVYLVWKGSKTNPSSVTRSYFFSVRAKALTFSDFYFYCLRCFLVNFQQCSTFQPKIIPNRMKKMPQKVKKTKICQNASQPNANISKKRLFMLSILLIKSIYVSGENGCIEIPKSYSAINWWVPFSSASKG